MISTKQGVEVAPGLYEVRTPTGTYIVPEGPQGSRPAIVSRIEKRSETDKGIMVGEAPSSHGNGTSTHTSTHTSTQTITLAMADYIEILLQKIQTHNPEVHAKAFPWYRSFAPRTMAKDLAHKTIDQLKYYLSQPPTSLPAQFTSPEPRTYITKDQVPPGYYALTSDKDGEIDFYRVKESKAGNLYVQVQASDAFHFVPNGSATILPCIAEDPRAASILYGHTIGSCGVCNRTLTDAESLAAGIGPICRTKLGW